MRNIGAPELVLILAVLVLLFGAKKLPDISRSLGRSMRIFKSEINQMKDDDKTPTTPTPTPEPRPIEGTIERPTPEPRQVVPDPERREP
jgi:sec-independent protein translocase protein TatA